MKFQFLPENFSRSENAPPFETRKICQFEVERIFLKNKKMLQDLGTALIFGRFYVNASANWTVIQRDDGYYKYNASFSFSVNDKFDFSTNIHILSFGLLSLGKSFDINLSWQEFRNGVFE